MRIIKNFGLIFVIFITLGVLQTAYEISYRLIFGKASYSTEAVLRVSQTDIEIILERRCIHLFLAEYERTLVVRTGGKEILREDVAGDSGGYSRMNIYMISPTKYFLSGALSFDIHELDIARMELNSSSLSKQPASAKFIGAFDFDKDKERVWRFISVNQRPEISNLQQLNY